VSFCFACRYNELPGCSREERAMRTTQAPPEAIRQFCQRYHIKRLSLVSALPDNDAPDESLDILVEFDADAPALDFYVMQAELGRLLGRPVSLVSADFLCPYFRDDMLDQGRVLYQRA
jgi:predicted nucleotidyltransferase